MKNKIKEILKKLNDWKIIILIVFIITSLFYWYELRPNIIKRQCSWDSYVTNTPAVPAVPAFPGETMAEAEQKFKIMQRDYKGPEPCPEGVTQYFCDLAGPTEPPPSADYLILPPRPAIAAIPEGPDIKVTVDASESEYIDCLRHHGL